VSPRPAPVPSPTNSPPGRSASAWAGRSTPTEAVGRLLLNFLAVMAEFDLIRPRTREGMKVAKAKGRLRCKQPKLNRREQAHLVSLVHSGEYTPPRSPNSSESTDGPPLTVKRFPGVCSRCAATRSRAA